MTTKDDDTAKPSEAATSQTKQSSSTGSAEFEPPLACVRRMLKNTLPTNTNVGKDACSAFSRACGIFIIYLTACANDFARESKRQTITANDILAAIEEIDFEEFSPKLTAFIEKHRAMEKKKKERKKSEDLAKASTSPTKREREDDETEDKAEGTDVDDTPNKRQKLDEDVEATPAKDEKETTGNDEKEATAEDGENEE